MKTFAAHRLPLLALSAGFTLIVGATAGAAAPEVRRPGEPLSRTVELGAAERTRILARVQALGEAIGIPGQATGLRREFDALDRVAVDEVAIRSGDGRATAVLRTDAGRGTVRSLVRLDWTADADRARVDARTAPGRARRYAHVAGLSAPVGAPAVAWDDAMRAWRVAWARTIDGLAVAGDGLTVWVYRGGGLAALRRIETPAAPAPARLVGPQVALDAARGWAIRAGLPAAAQTIFGVPGLEWVRPNDYATRGGADAMDGSVHLAYRVELAIRPQGGSIVHRVLLFVDAATGTLIAGAESA